MLELNPNKRITSKEALDHPFFKEDNHPVMCLPEELPKIGTDSHEFQSRQNKQKQQQAGKQVNPQANIAANAQFKPKERGDMIVGKHGYNNPNYYNKNASKQGEAKLKLEEPNIINQSSNLGVNNQYQPSRLEALCSNTNQSNEINFLHNKRHIDPTREEDDEVSHKKPRNFSP